LGYTVVNDVTAIDVRKRGLGEGREELPGSYSVVRVRGHTADMRLGVAELIEYLSQDITLYPGDLIATGAMATAAYTPQVSVQIGDMVEMEFGRIAILRNCIG